MKYPTSVPSRELNRRQLMLSAAAAVAATPAGLTHAAPKAASEVALDRHLNQLAEELLRRWPDQATGLGLDKGARAPLKSRLPDASGAAQAEDHVFCARSFKSLATFPDDGLSSSALLSKRVTAYALQLGAEANAFDYGANSLLDAMTENASPYVVNQQWGAYSATPDFLDAQHSVDNAADAEAYLARLSELARVLDQENGRIASDAGRGVIPPSFILANTIGQQKAMLAVPYGQSRLVTSLEKRTGRKGIAGDWAGRAARIVEQRVNPALSRQYEVLKRLQIKAGDDAGVWRLKDGEAYYAWLLKAGTTTGLSSDHIHRTGLDQTREIGARMDALLKAQGLTSGAVGERMTALGKDPRFLFPDTEAGRDDLIAYLNGLVTSVRPKLSEAFGLKLNAPLEVRRVPEEIQDGAALGYMNTGSLDGKRPSIYYINLSTTTNWPRYYLPTLTFHEGLPGHAWQGAYLTETRKTPLIRNLLAGFNGYVEGYALYAEQLADEIGMYRDDWAGQLGYLQAQQFRAVRLVVDTGLHAKRWTRDKAIEWSMEATGRTRNAMTSEIDRYCVTPGQACGYKVGQNEINRLREKAKTALGARYSPRAYNDLLVETGPVPLTVLAEVVQNFITGAKL